MSEESILSQDEISTLLNGVSNGNVSTEAGKLRLEVAPFDFRQAYNILVSRLPKLEVINKRFVKGLTQKLREAYRNEAEIELAFLHTTRFSEFLKGFSTPSNMNLVRVNVGAESSAGMVILDPCLLYILVDNYFGGSGDLAGRKPSNAFSPIELKMSERFMKLLVGTWEAAWSETAAMRLEVTGREDNVSVAHILDLNEVVFQAAYQISFNGNIGEFHVMIPYSIIEGLKEKLGKEGPEETTHDDTEWYARLKREVSAAEISVSSSIDDVKVTFKELLELCPGDIVPMDMPEILNLYVEGIPVFEGQLGTVNGKNAIKIVGSYNHVKRRRASINR